MTRCAALLGLVFFVSVIASANSLFVHKHDGDALPPGASLRIGTTRWRHEGWILSIQFARDGKSVLTCDNDGPWLWDAFTGQPIRRFRGDGYCFGAALSPDGKFIAASGDGGTVRIWDVATREEKRLETNHRGTFDFVLSSDGKTLATGNIQDTRTWDLATGKLNLTIPALNDSVNHVAFSPAGNYLACCTCGGTITVWDVQSNRRVTSFQFGSDAAEFQVPKAAFTPDGLNLVVAGSVREWDVGRFNSVPTIRVFEVASGKSRLEILPDSKKRHDSHLSVAVAADGRTIAAFSGYRGVLLFDAKTGQQLREWAVPNTASYLDRRFAFSPDGKTLATTGGLSPVLYLWDVATGKQVQAYPDNPEGSFWKIIPTPDGQRLVTLGQDKTICIWDARTGKQIKMLDRWDTWEDGLTISPDGMRLACSTIDGFVACYDLTSMTQVWKTRLAGFGATGLAFSPDSRNVACIHVRRKDQPPNARERVQADCIQFWDALTGKEVRRIPMAVAGGGLLAFSADGAALYVHAWLGRDVCRLDAISGKQLGRVMCPSRFTCMIPEHKLLLTGHRAGAVVITDLEKGTEIRRIAVSGDECSVAVSRDGKHVATAPSNYNRHRPTHLTIRELATDKVVTTLALPDDLRITDLQFTPDGKHLFTGTMNCNILFWDWLREAEKR